jgi:3-deoxy-D-manno-octulosonate 8-phosphate phosphatase (KDO 8-P phosphatase)
MLDPKLAQSIRCLVLDVDGVLTDGSIMIDDHGVETKRFNVKDGLGIATWIRLGFEVAVITKRKSRVASGDGALAHRCRELGIQHLIQGSADKAAALAEVTKATGIPSEQMAYIGDDWPDLPALRLVGLPIAVADAAEEVQARAEFVTSRNGGHGAVREAIEKILKAKGVYADVMTQFGE